MNKVQHVKWCMKQTKLTSEISCPTDSCLAQLVRHWPEDPEVLVSIPTGGNFWRNFFCSSLCKNLSDNLTETPIVKNSTVKYLFYRINCVYLQFQTFLTIINNAFLQCNHNLVLTNSDLHVILFLISHFMLSKISNASYNLNKLHFFSNINVAFLTLG